MATKEKLEIGDLSHSARVALRAFAMLAYVPGDANRKPIEVVLAGALARLGTDPVLFENVRDFPELLSPTIARLIQQERQRTERVDYLLEHEPDGGWRIKPTEDGDAETLFKMARDRPA